MDLKRKSAIAAAALAVDAHGGNGVAMAEQSTSATAALGGSMSSLATQAADQAVEGPENASDDGPNQCPDANANEPGHQDVVEDDANEGPENAADDGANEGPEDPTDDAPAAG